MRRAGRISPVQHPLTALLPCLAWLIASAALAGEFKSQRGFSITCPDGWSLATREPQKDAAGPRKAEPPQPPGVNLEKVAVFLYNPAPAGRGENVNVVVVPGRVPMTEASCVQYRNGLVEQYGRRGATVNNVDCTLARVGDRDALSWHCDIQFPGFPIPLRQWQVVLSSRSQAYIVTCTAPAAAYTTFEPIFTRIVDSVRIEPDSGFSWIGLPRVAQYAIIGGLIGGLVGGIAALARRARRKASPAS